MERVRAARRAKKGAFMHKTATLPLLLLALLGAASCGESDSVAPDDDVDVDVDVTGTWTGTLLFDIAGEGI